MGVDPHQNGFALYVVGKMVQSNLFFLLYILQEKYPINKVEIQRPSSLGQIPFMNSGFGAVMTNLLQYTSA